MVEHTQRKSGFGFKKEGGGRFGKVGKDGKRLMRRRDKRDDGFRFRKKTCRFCEEKVTSVDYKDMRRFERLISERGKILSRRISGMCAKHQRKLEEAVKRARFMALVPFLKK